MKRRGFIFRSLQSALLFSPVFELRRVYAQSAPKKVIPFFFVDGGSPYPRASDFFPKAGANGNFALPPILTPFENLKKDMVVLEGVNINSRGPNIKNNWHVSSVGKVLTAKAVHEISGTLDGLPGGPSIDQVIAKQLNVRSMEVLVNNRDYQHMRARPFATGNRSFKHPVYQPAQVWDQLFKNCQPTNLQTQNGQDERLRRLKAKKSIMDDLIVDLSRLRRELSGIEKVKLDSHENAIRQAEKSVAIDLKDEEERLETNKPIAFDCKKPNNLTTSNLQLKSKAHFDIIYAALKSERVGVAGMMHGYSSVQWNFDWINFNPKLNDDVHDAVFHYAGSQRENFIKVARWKWAQLAEFAEKLKNEPGESLLNKVLIYGTSHFGLHHKINNIPVVLIGNAQGQLQTGRSLKVKTDNDKTLTSVAHFCGAKIKGIGDNLNCGPLNVLHS